MSFRRFCPFFVQRRHDCFKARVAGRVWRRDSEHGPNSINNPGFGAAELLGEILPGPALQGVQQLCEESCRDEMDRNIERLLASRNNVARKGKVEAIAAIVNTQVPQLVGHSLVLPYLWVEAGTAKHSAFPTAAGTRHHDFVWALDFRKPQDPTQKKSSGKSRR